MQHTMLLYLLDYLDAPVLAILLHPLEIVVLLITLLILLLYFRNRTVQKPAQKPVEACIVCSQTNNTTSNTASNTIHTVPKLMTKTMSINSRVGCYCKTELTEENFYFTWNIVDFWNICNLNITLYSSIDENNLKFSMVPKLKEDKVEFYCHISDNMQQDALYNFGIIYVYSVFLNTDKGFTNKVNRQPMHFDNKTRKVLLYTLSTSLVPTTYLLGFRETLSIFIQFYKIVAYNNKINLSKFVVKKTDISVPKEKSDSFVTFIINDQRLKADKILLCSKSQVFEAMFNCGLKESVKNEVEITDVKYDTLKELLCFIETGHLSNDLMAISEIHDLFVVANKYDIQDLKLICEQHLIINTTVENVVTNLKIAHLNNGKSLEEYAKSFIKLYLKDISNTSEFITLMQIYPELLTQIKDMQTFTEPANISSIWDK